MTLEIDEGDNAPLTLAAAHAVVRVPRLVFKARAGQYRILLGGDGPVLPRYDLVTLRQELLAYSAVSVAPGGLQANAAFRRGIGDYFRKAPPTVLLWVTILAAIVALVALTIRAIDQTAPPERPPQA
jgi:hypothetical protein